MNKSNVYLAVVTPVVIACLWLVTSSTEMFSDFVRLVFDELGYSEYYGVKAVSFFSDSLSKLASGHNLVYYTISLVGLAIAVSIFSSDLETGIFALLVAIGCYPIANLFVDAVWVRRIVFLAIFMPSIPKLWLFLRIGIEWLGGGALFQGVLKGLSAIFLAVCFIPGFYLPPFYDGIAGWYLENNSPERYSFKALRIRYVGGAVAWFRPSFFSPITMHSRPVSIIRRRDPDFYHSTEFGYFLLALYERAYPALTEGYLPTQQSLGGLSYAPHTLDRFDERERYGAPEDVTAFEWVQVQGNVDSRSEIIRYTWSVTEPVSTLSGGDYSHPL